MRTTNSAAKTFPDQIRSFDEECAAIAAKAGFELARERIETIPNQIVVIAGVESGARARRPPKKKLTARVGRQRVVVHARTHKNEARELISRTKRVDVVVKRSQVCVSSHEAI